MAEGVARIAVTDVALFGPAIVQQWLYLTAIYRPLFSIVSMYGVSQYDSSYTYYSIRVWPKI